MSADKGQHAGATPKGEPDPASGCGVLLLFEPAAGTPYPGEVQAAIESLPEHMKAPSQVSQRSFNLANEAFRTLDRVCAPEVLHEAVWAVMSWDGCLSQGLASLSGAHFDKLRAHGTRLSVLLSTEAGRVVSASDDGTISLWDIEVGRQLHSLCGPGSPVTTLALTPDQRVLAGFRNGDLRIWDLRSGQEQVALMLRRTQQPLAPAASRAPRSVRSFWRRIWLYLNEPIGGQRAEAPSTSSQEAPVLVPAASGAVHTVATDRSGQLALSGDDDGVLSVWDLKQRALLYTLTDDGETARTRSWACVITPEGCALTGREDGALCLYDLATQRLRWRWPVREGQRCAVSALVLVAEGRHVIAGTDDGTLRRLDLSQGTPRVIWEARQEDAVLSCAVSADGRSVVSAARNMLTLWDAETGEKRAQDWQQADIWSLAIVGDQVIVGCADGTLRAKSLALFGVVRSLVPQRTTALLGTVSHYVRAVDDNTLQRRDVRTGAPGTEIPLAGAPIQAVDPVYGTPLVHVQQQDGQRTWVNVANGTKVAGTPEGALWLEVNPPTSSRGMSMIVPVATLRSAPPPPPPVPVLLDGPAAYKVTMGMLARHLLAERSFIQLESWVRPITQGERARFEEQFRAAEVMILLLHADYLAGLTQSEKDEIEARCEKKQLRLIPLMLKECDLGSWPWLSRQPVVRPRAAETLDTFCAMLVAELRGLLEPPQESQRQPG